jgi:hypothetical protein
MTDIGRYGAAAGVYSVKEPGVALAGWPESGSLRLVRIDEHGQLHTLGPSREWDAGAPTREEAVLHHFAGEIDQADRALEAWKSRRRSRAEDSPAQDRRAQGKTPPEPVVPTDPATSRFMGY